MEFRAPVLNSCFYADAVCTIAGCSLGFRVNSSAVLIASQFLALASRDKIIILNYHK